MGDEARYQCNSYIHCFVNGRFVCECGSEWYDSVLTEMIIALSTLERPCRSADTPLTISDHAAQAAEMLLAKM